MRRKLGVFGKLAVDTRQPQLQLLIACTTARTACLLDRPSVRRSAFFDLPLLRVTHERSRSDTRYFDDTLHMRTAPSLTVISA